MKYMHFKASCSYAALAILLEFQGVDTEDTAIALEMDLPRLFAEENGAFLSGPMLQGEKWFNLWCLPRGYTMSDTIVKREALCQTLKETGPSMLGIQTPYGKHAVVFSEYDGAFHFLNPTYESSGEKTELLINEDELLNLVDDELMLGVIRPSHPQKVNMVPLYDSSIQAIQRNLAAIICFSSVEHTQEEYFAVMNTLFRPLLLDGISMLELAGEKNLAEELRSRQSELMSFLRDDCKGKLSDTLSISHLQKAVRKYVSFIRAIKAEQRY